MNMNFTVEICNKSLIRNGDFLLKIPNKVLNQLAMPSQNRSAAEAGEFILDAPKGGSKMFLFA